MNTLPNRYNYLDLRFHSYMYEYHDFRRNESPLIAFFRYVLNEERETIEDYSDKDVHDALKRQFNDFVSRWDDDCERAFERVILIVRN